MGYSDSQPCVTYSFSMLGVGDCDWQPHFTKQHIVVEFFPRGGAEGVFLSEASLAITFLQVVTRQTQNYIQMLIFCKVVD